MLFLVQKYKNILQKRQNYALVLLALFVVGFCIGALFCSNFEGSLLSKNAVEFYILALKKDSSVISLLFSRILFSLASFALFFGAGLLIFLYPIHFVVITYRGYILGACFVVFVSQFGLTGIVLFLFGVFLQNVITTLALTLFSVVALDYLKTKKRGCGNNFYNYLVLLVATFLLSVAGCVAECVILGLIIRPLNFYF